MKTMAKKVGNVFKSFADEIAQVKWLEGRQLMIDTGYVLAFSGLLLIYFTVIDSALSELVKRIVSS
ncbi:MAG: preprotein translocase subunit SecE [Culicoidibacterales bacterium]